MPRDGLAGGTVRCLPLLNKKGGVDVAQPEFYTPDFLLGSSAGEIHERMMESLPDDIDDMDGGFAYDLTKPAAVEKAEIIEFHLARAVMLAFPQYAWDEWLDYHGQQVHVERHPPRNASGEVKVSGKAGGVIPAGTVFCTPATETGPSIGFRSLEEARIGEDGTVLIPVSAVEGGAGSNVAENKVTLMAKPDRNVTEVTNPEPIRGGTERERDDDYYDRISAEYQNSMTYIGNDADYVRWAKEAGAGECIVVPCYDGPGTVKLILVDQNGQPANDELVSDVYDYIVSPQDRTRRLLPAGCAKIECASATVITIDYKITGLLHDGTASMEQIKEAFGQAVKAVYNTAKKEGMLRYNDIRPLISGIAGVEDFDVFLINGGMLNIRLGKEEYPETGTLDFR